MMGLPQGYKQPIKPGCRPPFAVASLLCVNLITCLTFMSRFFESRGCLQIIGADADRAMLAYYSRRQEEHKVVYSLPEAH